MDLAIIIPAYKKTYLEATLNSIAGQTNKNFNVYVGDDESEHDLKSIVNKFNNSLPVTYFRFNENLGSSSLVKHWHRCIALSKDEPWLWIFPDDDVMDEKCVEYFFDHLDHINNQKSNVVRFNTRFIYDNENLNCENEKHPALESGAAFIIERLQNNRFSSLCEYIFTRKTFVDNKGFVDFPLAWASDDASWLKFSGNKQIYTIDGPRVNIRMSNENISNNKEKYREQKINACLQYLLWLKNNFPIYLKGFITLNEFKKISKRWFYFQLRGVDAALNASSVFSIAWKLRKVWGWGLNNQFNPVINFHPLNVYRIRIMQRIKNFFGTGSR